MKHVIIDNHHEQKRICTGNKAWIEEKAQEEGVKALPRGIYYKVLA